LDEIYLITSSGQSRLRIEIIDWNGAFAWAEYRSITFYFICKYFACTVKSIHSCFYKWVFVE